MNSNDSHLNHVTVDGQDIILPNSTAWLILKEDPQIDGQWFGGTSSLDKWIKYHLDFVNRYPDFVLALHHAGKLFLAPLLLFRVDDRWQRVHIENCRCNVCEWQGVVATPLVRDLYFGVQDAWAVLESSLKIPIAHCPNCNSQLPKERHPIWAEPLKTNRVVT